MGSLAFLLWQATRLALGSPRLDDSAWAVAILLVAAVVLAYHLYCLRADLLLARTIEPRDVSAPGPQLAIEMIEISAPAGADFKVLNAAIRSELPDGYQLRVLPRS